MQSEGKKRKKKKKAEWKRREGKSWAGKEWNETYASDNGDCFFGFVFCFLWSIPKSQPSHCSEEVEIILFQDNCVIEVPFSELTEILSEG